MKRLRAFVATISLAAAGISGCLVLMPVEAFAATCTALCSGGRSITCSSDYRCTAIDGVGCFTESENGVMTESSCP
jgi:hypothetical protein